MDHAEGFFPEREILAMRRQQQLPVDPVQPDDSQRKVVLVALAGGFLFPILFADWNTGVMKRPAVLLVACYLLAGFALVGIVIGLYRALRSGKRLPHIRPSDYLR